MSWIVGAFVFFFLTFVFGMIETGFDALLGIRRDPMKYKTEDRIAMSGCLWIVLVGVAGAVLWIVGFYAISIFRAVGGRI